MKRHLKRLGIPESWPSKKKGITFITKPKPGPHKQEECITLLVLMRDLLKIGKTSKEIKKILNSNAVLVDNVIRKDHRLPLGVMDVISIPSLNKYYRLILNKKGKFELLPVKKEDSSEKICRIANKTIMKKKKLQLNLYDGKNIAVDKDVYKVGDSVIISNNKVKKHLKLEKGAVIYIVSGKHTGEIGKLDSIKKYNGVTKDTVVISVGKDKIETSKNHVFVIENELDARSKA